MSRRSAILQLVMLYAICVSSLIALHGLAVTYPLPASTLSGITSWLTQADPVIACLTIVRVTVIAAVWYLLLSISLSILLRWLGWWQAVALIDQLSPMVTRQMAVRIAALSAAISLTASTSPAFAASSTSITMRHLNPGEDPPRQTTTTTTTTTTSAPLPDPQRDHPAHTAQSPPDQDPITRQRTVLPGENFWTIAHDTLAQTLDRRPSDREVAAYWRSLVEMNRPALVTPANPDLLFAGQVVDLPPVSH